ncbi:hypothetical protein EMIT0357P_10414 [Pseudomonas marginalis]
MGARLGHAHIADRLEKHREARQSIFIHQAVDRGLGMGVLAGAAIGQLKAWRQPLQVPRLGGLYGRCLGVADGDGGAFAAGLQVAIIRRGGGVQSSELKALQQLPLIIQQQGFERQGSFTIKVKLKTVAVLITGCNRHNHCITTGHARFADNGQFVELIESLWIEGARGCITRIAKAGDKSAADALSTTVYTNDFLSRTIELQEPLTDLAILDTMPDVMGRKTAITFVDKRTLKTLLLLCTPKSSQPVLGVVGMGGECKPTTEQ